MVSNIDDIHANQITLDRDEIAVNKFLTNTKYFSLRMLILSSKCLVMGRGLHLCTIKRIACHKINYFILLDKKI